MIDKLFAKLKEIANKKAAMDDPEWAGVDDYAGGNIDDAYGIGMEDGEIALARQLVKEFFPESS